MRGSLAENGFFTTETQGTQREYSYNPVALKRDWIINFVLSEIECECLFSVVAVILK